MPEFFDWQPSERYGELRNDGRSVHHRNELEKVFASIAMKIAELRAEIYFRDPSHPLRMTEGVAGMTDEIGGS